MDNNETPQIKYYDELIRRHQPEVSKCWSPHAIIYDPLKAGSIDTTDVEPHDKAILRAMNADYKPNYKVVGKPECTVFVSNLDYQTKQETIKSFFSRYGKIVRCRLVEDIVTGRSRGYAFIEYSTEREALRTYKQAYRQNLDGRTIFVDMECERLLPGWIPRRLGGGFNGKKESGQLRFGGRDRPFKKPIGLLTSKEILFQLDEKLSEKL